MASRTKRAAFRPGTRANHMTGFRAFLTFCTYFSLDYINPASTTLCAYVIFLARTFTSTKAIRNYISAIGLLHKLLNIKAHNLESFDLFLVLRAMTINNVHLPRLRSPVTVQLLLDLSQACTYLPLTLGRTFKCLILFAFYGFLRCSNMLPTSTTTFDPTRQLCIGDVFTHPPGLLLLIKWSKTNQTRNPFLLPLPSLPSHPLCPTQAFMDMSAASQTAPKPLFSISPGTPLTQSKARKLLHLLLTTIRHPNPPSITFHSFRRARRFILLQQQYAVC